MSTGHPVLWRMLCAVAAPLLAEIPLGFTRSICESPACVVHVPWLALAGVD